MTIHTSLAINVPVLVLCLVHVTAKLTNNCVLSVDNAQFRTEAFGILRFLNLTSRITLSVAEVH